MLPLFQQAPTEKVLPDANKPAQPLTPDVTPTQTSRRWSRNVEDRSDWPVIHGYEILDELGRGGMGVVYKACQKGLKRLVAIKMIHQQQLRDPEFLMRFQVEAEAIAKLDHPHIVKIHTQEILHHNGDTPTPYFVLEYVAGGDLREKWNRHPQPASQVAEVMEKLARAMDCAHRKGILHRDLKPANVLLTLAGEPKVTDFGVARIFEQSGSSDNHSPTRTGAAIGTPEYMAPEQLTGNREDHTPQIDVYALGVMLYEALTGRRPFEGLTDLDTLEQVRDRDPIPPRRLQPRIPVDLETICLKCLVKEPARRYSGAEDLAEDLARFLQHRPIRARRVHALEKAARWCRRNQAMAVLLACIIGIVVLAFCMVAWSYWRAEEARQFAEHKTKLERWERYRSHVTAAASALQLNNSSSAKRLLEAAPPEHRGWEWRHFVSRLDGAQNIIDIGVRHTRSPLFTLSPTSPLVAVGAFDGTVQWFDLAKGKVIASKQADANEIRALTFSPNGEWLAAASIDGKIRLWQTGSPPAPRILQGQRAQIERLVFDQTGRRLLAATSTQGLWIWDVSSGKQLRKINTKRGGGITIAPDGSRAVYCIDHVLFSLSLSEPMQSPIVFDKHKSQPSCYALDPTNTYMASASLHPENAIRVWHLATGKERLVLKAHGNAVHRVAFHPQGTCIASASADQTIRVWDAKTGGQLAVLTGHTGVVMDVNFSRDGTRLASASFDGTARLWDVKTGTCLGVLYGHAGPVYEARFSWADKQLVTRSVDSTLRIWDVRQCEAAAFRGHTSYVYDVAFSPNGKQVASAAWDGKLILWNCATLGMIRQYKHKADIVSSVSYNAAGTRLVTLSRYFDDRHGRDVTVWNALGGTKVCATHLAHSSYRDARAVFHPHQPWVAVGDIKGRVQLIDAHTGTTRATLDSRKDQVIDVAFHPMGTQLAAAETGGAVRIWNLHTRRLAASLLHHEQEAFCVLYNRQGNLLASASKDNTVCLWDTTTYKKYAVLPHGCPVYGLAFHPEGRMLATACADNIIRLWDVAKRQQVAELRGHAAYVHALSFSPDGTQLVSSSGDHMIRIWHTLSPRQRR